MFEPVLIVKVHAILTGKLWSVVCVADTWNAKPGKVSLGFVYDYCCKNVVKVIHFNSVKNDTLLQGRLSLYRCMKMTWLMICHSSVGIGSDLIASFIDFDPYCAQVLLVSSEARIVHILRVPYIHLTQDQSGLRGF